MVPGAELLRTWEEGAGRPPVARSLLAFALARPEIEVEGLLDATVGERDASLLSYRIAILGPTTEAVADCPACGERLDLCLDLRDFLFPEKRAEGRAVTIRDLIDAPTEARAFCDFLRERTVTDDASVLAARDPQADILLDLRCPVCGAAWPEPFDIAGFLWAELEERAMCLLGEIHALARAYGWSEREILALSPARRFAYLSLLGAA